MDQSHLLDSSPSGLRVRLSAVLTRLLAAVATLAGCYAYVPMEFDAAALGAEVRAHLSREGAFAAEDQLGRAASATDPRARTVTLSVWVDGQHRSSQSSDDLADRRLEFVYAGN